MEQYLILFMYWAAGILVHVAATAAAMSDALTAWAGVTVVSGNLYTVNGSQLLDLSAVAA